MTADYFSAEHHFVKILQIILDLKHPLKSQITSRVLPVGAIFFPFVFRFLIYLLSCSLFLFALRYFVNYAPLLRAVCKFGYSLLSPPFFVEVDLFLSGPDHQPCHPQHLVSSFVFIVFH